MGSGVCYRGNCECRNFFIIKGGANKKTTEGGGEANYLEKDGGSVKHIS